MDVQDIVTYTMAAGNVGSLILLFRSWKSQERKDKALARQEEASSVSKTQEIYDKLTEVMNRELEKRDQRMEQQDKTIGIQASEIEMLRLTVEGYKKKCAECTKNQTQN